MHGSVSGSPAAVETSHHGTAGGSRHDGSTPSLLQLHTLNTDLLHSCITCCLCAASMGSLAGGRLWGSLGQPSRLLKATLSARRQIAGSMPRPPQRRVSVPYWLRSQQVVGLPSSTHQPQLPGWCRAAAGPRWTRGAWRSRRCPSRCPRRRPTRRPSRTAPLSASPPATRPARCGGARPWPKKR